MQVMNETRVKIKGARCDAHHKLFVFIDQHKTIYADDKEEVGSEVHFYAGTPCTVYFDNDNVFSTKEKGLNQGDNPLTVTGKKGDTTRYAIDRVPTPNPDPILVVP